MFVTRVVAGIVTLLALLVACSNPPEPTAAPPPPTPDTAAAIAAQSAPMPSELLYSEDFEDGLARDWSLGPGWQVSEIDGNAVLVGQGHNWANLNEGSDWTNYAFKFRLKVRAGSVHLNFRLLQGRQFTRYFIGFDEGGLDLNRQVGDDFTHIAARGWFPSPNTWHTVEIKSFAGHLQVFVDGERKLDLTDEEPLLQGTIAFETTEVAEVLIDDVEIRRLIEPLTSSPPAFTAFAGGPEGLGGGLNILSAIEAARILSAPDTRLITVDYDPTTRRVRVDAKAGAVPANAGVLVGNTELGDFVLLKADSEGAFEAEVDGHPGTHILIKQDTTGRSILVDERDHTNTGIIVAPGVQIRIPVPQPEEGIAFGSGGRAGGDVAWAIEGTFAVSALNLSPGAEMPLSGRVYVFTDEAVDRASLAIEATLLGDSEGRQVGRAPAYVSPFLTLTGVPIEGIPTTGNVILGGTGFLEWQFDGARWVADFETLLQVPNDAQTGLYEITARLVRPDGDSLMLNNDIDLLEASGWGMPSLGVYTVGDPPPMRLAATLLADELSEGSRGGVRAREDARSFDIGPRITTRHDPIIPRLDGYGDPWRYRLEPFVPMVGLVDARPLTTPAIPFDFSDSELTITLQGPNGDTDALGPAKLTRYAGKPPRTPFHQMVSAGGGLLGEITQLQGDGDTFAYRFPSDGDYIVTLKGHIGDIFGNTYPISGTYDVTVANTLDIETSLLPGTPFEVGNSIAPTLTIMPPVPADVTYTITHYSTDGTWTARTFEGRAGPNGWWDGGGEPFTFERDGEYRIDIEARYTDPDGSLWAGRLRFASAVATPDAPFIVHGLRGSDDPTTIRTAWGFARNFHDEPGGHIAFPYFTGDVIWGTEGTGEVFFGNSVSVVSSIQLVDENHPLVRRTMELAETSWGSDMIAEMLRAGQIPLSTWPIYSVTHPDEIDLWAYTYGSVQRPGVRIRELVSGGQPKRPYWRFNDAYNVQSGNDPVHGDLTGDFKFQYSATVLRDANAGQAVYAIYGSGWVLLPPEENPNARVFPPFQGAAGGPNGGPLFTVHGREIDMFFLPLGVRPGAVLETGDVFRLAGPIMPTLPSLVEYTVTAPDGTARTLGGRANAIGYFYDPSDDFVLDQAGLWNVTLKVTHDGMTSAGPVEPPYPTGGPLAPDGTTFHFVVVSSETHTLQVETDLAALSPVEWYYDGVDQATFRAVLPGGWDGDTARIIVTMPGTVLVDEDVRVSGGLISWDLNGKALNQLASNFDTALADTITVTFFAQGSVEGRPTQVAGTIITHGARVPLSPIMSVQ